MVLGKAVRVDVATEVILAKSSDMPAALLRGNPAKRQLNDKGGARGLTFFFPLGLGFYPDVPAVASNDLPGDGQSQAGAMLLSRGYEWFEYPGSEVFRNTGTRVRHGQLPGITQDSAAYR